MKYFEYIFFCFRCMNMYANLYNDIFCKRMKIFQQNLWRIMYGHGLLLAYTFVRLEQY